MQKFRSVALAAFAALCVASPPAWSQDGSDWRFSGDTMHNPRSAEDHWLSPRTAPQLHVRWVFTTAGDVSATPTVEGDSLYVPDWGGWVYRLNRYNGNVFWKVKLADLTGNAKSLSRTAVAIGDDSVVIGDQASGAVLALDKATGALRWKTLADSHPAAVITASPVIAQGRVYIGVASQEEFFAANGTYVPSFRGSAVALDLRTGRHVWQFKTAPDGYTGAAVWGSNPVVDLERHLIYIATGNNYSIPPAVSQCVATNAANPASCLAADDWVDSVLALDLDTGALCWGRRMWAPDTWTVSCIFHIPNCPTPSGQDYDFGSAPNLFKLESRDGREDEREILGIGQKSGVYWALNPDDGSLLWSTQVGPGGSLGGIEWGSAVDGQRVYVAITNSENKPYALAGGAPWNAGSWAALDARTGAILWQVPVTGIDPVSRKGGRGLGAVSVTNGVMFAGSTSGDMVAMDAATGQILWTFASGGSVASGPAIVKDTIYWGSGYGRFGLGIPNNKLYAFTVP